MKDGNFLAKVKEQYEDYPYPERDPAAEKGYLCSARATSLDSINHYCFEGNKQFDEKFRVLIAGGGTGDCTIYLAEQLRHTKADIVYLDMSTASMAVCKERAKVRQLDNITWIQDSLLNIPDLNLGKFDFITCTGVLHHLENPDDGLAALKSVLHEDGSMSIMVYGTHGRTGVYQMQELMRRINKGEDDIEKKLELTKRTLKALPPMNWFKFNMNSFAFDLSTDSGIYDLLLHTQDRSYTVPEFYEFFEKQGLTLNTLYECDHPMGNMIFEPKTFVRDPVLLAQIDTLPIHEQQAVCELLYGQYAKQQAYVSFKDKRPASLENQDLVPAHSTIESRSTIATAVRAAFCTERSPQIKINDFIAINRTALSALLFSEIDGQQSIKEIINSIADKAGVTAEQVHKELVPLYTLLIKAGFIFLKTKDLPDFPKIPEMEARMVELYGEEDCKASVLS